MQESYYRITIPFGDTQIVKFIRLSDRSPMEITFNDGLISILGYTLFDPERSEPEDGEVRIEVNEKRFETALIHAQSKLGLLKEVA